MNKPVKIVILLAYNLLIEMINFVFFTKSLTFNRTYFEQPR